MKACSSVDCRVKRCTPHFVELNEDTTMSTGDSLSKFEEVALLIEVTKNHLERLSNHRWNRFGPDGFELANEEIRGAIQ